MKLSAALVVMILLVLAALIGLYALSTLGGANLDPLPHVFKVHGVSRSFTGIADTEAARERGLMSTRITNSTFMLFAFPSPGKYQFWMRDTNSSLDIIWILGNATGGRVVDVARDVPTCQSSACPFYTPAADANFAIETKAGFSTGNNVTAGDAVVFS